MRLVHLGLGNFFRAHACWYTEHAPDAAEWGIAAFAGRRTSRLVADLAEQDGLYTLVTRAPGGDAYELIGAVSSTHEGTDDAAWIRILAAPDTAAVTLTITEAGYLLSADGGVDLDRPELRSDLAALAGDERAPVRTAPARLLAGLAARRRADAGPLAIVPCDNLAGNGTTTERVLRGLAERLDTGLVAWMDESVSVVSTMVDRITPRTTPGDVEAVRAATGLADRCPVITEPFREWVLSGDFPAGRPRWEAAGATFAADATPYEQRKLWLLNGGHSLLAYAGGVRGFETVAEAVGDERCRAWLEEWWSEASAHLTHSDELDLPAYRSALLERFANPRMEHRLEQIAADGSQKLPVRILPVVRAERAAGRIPEGAARILAAWLCHLRGAGASISDPRQDELVPLVRGPLRDAGRRALGALDPGLADDDALVAAVAAATSELAP